MRSPLGLVPVTYGDPRRQLAPQGSSLSRHCGTLGFETEQTSVELPMCQTVSFIRKEDCFLESALFQK